MQHDLRECELFRLQENRRADVGVELGHFLDAGLFNLYGGNELSGRPLYVFVVQRSAGGVSERLSTSTISDCLSSVISGETLEK